MPFLDPTAKKEYHRKYNKVWYSKNKSKYSKTCSYCSNTFITRYSSARFCSLQCFGKSKRNSQTCVLCKKEFHAPPSKSRKYCSQECMLADPQFINRVSKMGKEQLGKSKSIETRTRISKSQSGNLNHMWKGGITPEYRRLRNLKKYKEWRKKVFERDNYTCALCGSRNGKGHYVELNADHYPVPFKDILLRGDTDKLWELSSGRTLCVQCHKRITFRV